MDIAADLVTAIIERARLVMVKDADVDPDSGSNAIDDGMTDVLVSGHEDDSEQELRDVIEGLNEDERAALVALFWIGRGDYEAEEYPAAFKLALARRDLPTSDYLMGAPELPDLLDEGLAAMIEAGAAPAADRAADVNPSAPS